MLRASIAVLSLILLLCFACAVHSPQAGFVRAPGSPLPLGDGVRRPVLADMNGDGALDIVAPFAVDVPAGDDAGRVAVFLGNGDGSFRTPPATASVPLGGQKIAAGDLDEDGSVDVAVAAHDSYVVHLLFGDGRGGFRDGRRSVAARTGDQPHTHSVTLGDVDLDGHLDLLTANEDDGDVSVLLGDGKGGFAPAAGSPFAAGSHPYEGMVVTDVDGDRHPDVVVPNLHGSAVTILIGDGQGAFAHAEGSPFAVAPRPGSVAAGDLDGDGRVDVVATHDSGPLLSILQGTESGLALHSRSPLRLPGRAWDVRIVDLDGDGRNDLIMGGVGEDVFLRFGETGDTIPSRPAHIGDVGPGPGYLAVGDLDGDGRPDIVTGNFSGQELSVLLARD